MRKKEDIILTSTSCAALGPCRERWEVNANPLLAPAAAFDEVEIEEAEPEWAGCSESGVGLWALEPLASLSGWAEPCPAMSVVAGRSAVS